MPESQFASRFIQYIGNKPVKRDTILRTERQWERGSMIEVAAQEAQRYLQHPDIFRDVTDEIDDEGNPPPLPPLETEKPAAPASSAQDLEEREELRDALDAADAENARLTKQVEELTATVAARDETIRELEAEKQALYAKLQETAVSPESKPKDDENAKTAADGGDTPPTDPQVRQDDIITAFAELDTDNKEHFGSDGKPKVAAIGQVLGYDVTGKERDAAWQAVQAVIAANSGQ